MKRFVPFFVILAVAVITFATGTWIYRAKMKAEVRAVAASAEQAKAAAASQPLDSPEQKTPDSRYARGPATAPVTLEIYGDFQCPSCATTSGTIDELAKQYGGKMRVVFHEFPLQMHKHAVAAAMAAEAAGEQGHFWEMHDRLYQYQPVWSRVSDPNHFFNAYAQEIGLDPVRFNADLHSTELRSRLISSGNAGVRRGVKNTPTIFVNGVELRGIFNENTLREAIDSALAAKGAS